MSARACSFVKENGEPCGAAPMRDGDYCFWHCPEHAADAAEASRLGGLRRRKERITTGVYDLEGFGSVEGIRRFLEIAALDTVALDNSVARSRTMAYIAQVGLKVLQVGELEKRVQALEDALQSRTRKVGGGK